MPSESLLDEPLSVTVTPEEADWLIPALAVGATFATGGGRGEGFSPPPPPQALSSSAKPAQAMPGNRVRISDLYRTCRSVSESEAVSIWRQ